MRKMNEFAEAVKAEKGIAQNETHRYILKWKPKSQ